MLCDHTFFYQLDDKQLHFALTAEDNLHLCVFFTGDILTCQCRKLTRQMSAMKNVNWSHSATVFHFHSHKNTSNDNTSGKPLVLKPKPVYSIPIPQRSYRGWIYTVHVPLPTMQLSTYCLYSFKLDHKLQFECGLCRCFGKWGTEHCLKLCLFYNIYNITWF